MKESLEGVLRRATPEVAKAITKALDGGDLDEEATAQLLDARGADRRALLTAADQLRREQVGDDVSYVVTPNINFTNVCVKRCGFCAFSRTYRNREGYLLPIDEVVRRAREAHDFGATEVCIQAGLPPDMPGDLYIRICQAVKEALPDIHIHGFSPEEVLYGASRSGASIREYLRRLKAAGVGSLPGTSAEILVQDVRDRISPGRITVEEWVTVIRTAHALGIPTTSTIMYGHLETKLQAARHLILVRDLQRESHGFTEFVPLSFIHTEAPMFREARITGIRPGATAGEVFNMHAAARLVLGRDIPNLQVSWVKEGLERSRALLAAGANDLGGTLINESISTAAGAPHGQLVRPSDLRRLIRTQGRTPVERLTLYQPLKRFDDPRNDPIEPLDHLDDEGAARFGSYRRLIRQDDFRFAVH